MAHEQTPTTLVTDTRGASAETRQGSWFLTPATVASVLAGLVLALVMSGSMFWIGHYYRGEAAATPGEEKKTLSELRADDLRELRTYGWINRPDGTVRIPIERAIELLVAEAARENSEMPSESDD